MIGANSKVANSKVSKLKIASPKVAKLKIASPKVAKLKIASPNVSSKSKSDDKLTKKYQRKTDKQHILDNPDTYIGSIEHIDAEHGWTFANADTSDNTKCGTMVYRPYQFIPGFYKLFDEAIVNCRDHEVRMRQSMGEKINGKKAKQVSYINVDIEPITGMITMTNDGNGIDIAKHPEFDIWIPEMIFAHLRTSTNYDKTEKRIVGGKNGFGFKLVLIWSTWGRIETVDHTRRLKYVQEFSNNLDVKQDPVITAVDSAVQPYTKISFIPDYARLGITDAARKITPDMLALFEKRVVDIAALTSTRVTIRLNQRVVPIDNFQKYAALYIGEKSAAAPRIYESCSDRWEFVVAMTPESIGEFAQVSFVNGIYTSKGGKHVDYILNQIVKKMMDYITKKKKITVKASSIKENLMLFVRCDIDNPAFDSQTKDYLNTPISKFGSTCKVSDGCINKLAKMGIMELAISLSEIKTNNSLKKLEGKKVKNVRGIPKLTDANHAGTAKSSECCLILCEGDSAKSGIVSGLSKDDRNFIGIYPLKGKIMNVAGEKREKIYNNTEIKEIIQILGLKSDQDYSDQAKINKMLRYGKVIFMTDQDLDGSHIKALGVNLFYNEWSCLLKIPRFLGYMNTPIIKAKKGKIVHSFYNEQSYMEWRGTLANPNLWNIKYYKGLGTSTSKEFKEYLSDRKLIYFEHNDDECHDRIDLAFNKKRPDDRKRWLTDYDQNDYLMLTDEAEQSISYRDFIDKDLKHFSIYDNERSIPNLVDGLKVSLRKVLFAAFKKKLFKEIKVAQFSGYVSETTAYHHGEASLNAAIKGFAQNYVGSNNINLLVPSGQFGTRLQGGKDAGSERYIYTYLNSITRKIYPEADDAILDYLDDDGQSIQPEYYLPILPMILVNGTIGIGTGFSTQVLSYNPVQIIDYITDVLETGESSRIVEPYYHGFKGDIVNLVSDGVDSVPKYLIKGKYTVLSATQIEITELPVFLWTENFKQHLEKLLEAKKPIIKDYTDLCTDTEIHFKIKFVDDITSMHHSLIEYGCNKIEKLLKLYTTVNTSNMYLFNDSKCLVKFNTIYSIIQDHYKIRFEGYIARKRYYLGLMQDEIMRLRNKVNFINGNLDDTIDLRRKSKETIDGILTVGGFDRIDDNYNYLIKMSMDSVTQEKVDELTGKYEEKLAELGALEKKQPREIWLDELAELKEACIDIGINNNTPKTTKLKLVKPGLKLLVEL